MMQPRRVLGAACAAALLAGCSASTATSAAHPPVSGSSTPTDSPTPSSTATSTAPPDPSTDPAYAKFYDQTVDWSSCGTLECGSVKVPVDWTNPGGATIRLAVNRMRATGPGKRIGSLFTNPGGPGGSGVQFVQAAGQKIPSEVRERYDVVGFDPRGVGSSAPIHCLTDSQLDTFLATDPDPTTAAQIAEVEEEAQFFAEQCKKNGALLANMGTPSVARDLDVLRAAVGDSTLHYLGYSYGTYIGEVYAGLFPTHVGRMVLDGVIDPALTTAQISLGQAQGFQLAYSSFVKDCLSTSSCPLGSSIGQVTDRIERMLTSAQDDPLHTTTVGQTVDTALATTGILAAMYTKKEWPYLRSAIAAAEGGNGTQLLTLAYSYFERKDGHYETNQNESIYAVNCLDHPGADTPAEIKALLPQLTDASPLFGPFIAWGNLPCYYWPVQSTSEPGPIHAPGTPPIVVIGTTRDPATPYQWAKNVAEELDSGVFLSHDGDGHTTFGEGNKCVDSAVDTYLLTGTPPDKGTMC